jgi:hypothetical protein
MSMTKVITREGCKNASLIVLVGLALATVAVGSAAAARAALAIGNPAHREALSLSNTGSISHDGPAQKGPFTRKLYKSTMEPSLDMNVALGSAREAGAVMRMAADSHEFFADAGSARRLTMEDEMKTGYKKSKKDPQLDSPVGAHPAVMFPKQSDEDSQMREPKPAKAYRPPTPPKSKAESR